MNMDQRAGSRRLDLHDDRGSLPFLMLIMLITTALGAVILATVVTQTRTSTFNESRARALDAAQGGIDVTLSRIRTAVDATESGRGDAGRLPCYNVGGATEPWVALGPGDTTEYRVLAVDYYRTNPALMTASDRSSKTMICSPQAGTFDRETKERAPRFAIITIAGRDVSRSGSGASPGRTLKTTYEFQTNDANVTGGLIRIYPAAGSTTPLCMDAGSDTGKENDAVKLQACSTTTPPTASQIWAYRGDLSLELVSSIPEGGGAGLCIDAAATPSAANVGMVLKRCGAADYNPRQPNAEAVCPAGFTRATYATKYPGKTCAVSADSQRFAVDDNAHLRQANVGATDNGALCIDAAVQAADTPLRLQSCTPGTTDARQTWVPSPTAGAGGAGAGNKQIVNYSQFATCIDFTGQSVTADYQILYTCKQNPNPDKVAWNQKLVAAENLVRAPKRTLLVATYTDGVRYCFKSLGTAPPKLQRCAPGDPLPDSLYWTVYQRYVSDAADSPELAYRDRYTIKDYQGRCLGPGPNSDLHSGQYYKIVTSACDGSTGQKWNADPSSLTSSLSGLREMGIPPA